MRPGAQPPAAVQQWFIHTGTIVPDRDQDEQKIAQPASIGTVALYGGLSFLLILAISFEYYYFIAVYRWSPKFLDTCIPFSLGLFEIAAIFFLDEPRMLWACTAAVAAIGAIAFLNTRSNCKPNMFPASASESDPGAMYRFVKRYVAWDRVLSAVIVVVASSMLFLYQDHPRIMYWSLWDIVAVVFAGFVLGMPMWAHHFVRKLHLRLRLTES